MDNSIYKSLIKGHSQYRLEPIRDGVKKVFNRGMGLLSFIRVNEEKGELVINSVLWRKTDAPLAVEIMRASKTPLVVKCVDFGYPLWYNHGLESKIVPLSDAKTKARILADMDAYAARTVKHTDGGNRAA